MVANGVRVNLLGPVEVLRDAAPIGPAGRKRRGLLAYLALHANDVVTVSELIDAVWGERPPASATGLVQTYVSAWRKVLDDGRLTTVGAGYRLGLAANELDLASARDLCARGRVAAAHDVAGACELYRKAWQLWRGPALVDLADEPFAAAAAVGLEDLRLQALEGWAAAALTGGDGAAVREPLREALQREPLREQLSELLMWALFQVGRQADAFVVFEQTRALLADELGADPGAALQAMHGRLLRQDPTLRPPRSRSARPRNEVRLPRDSFVGRDAAVADVMDLVANHRLVTLTGPGGSGKTRLAIEVAGRLLGTASGADDDLQVVVVEGGLVTKAGELLDRLAADLDVEQTTRANDTSALFTALSEMSLLLVLDNLEHLAGAGTVVLELLRATERVRVLATSQAPLHVRGEQRCPVRPLLLPVLGETDPALSTAVQLFLDRAAAVEPAFTADGARLLVIAEICRALDGLPLAIELAAPWVSVLSVEALRDHLANPLVLLRSDDADRPDRHRTLRATLDWSYEQLDDAERTLLQTLAVFAGPISLEALEAVVDPVLKSSTLLLLQRLLDKNLVHRTVAGASFQLLQTVRAYAIDKLESEGGDLAARSRHAEHFTGVAEQVALRSEGPEAAEWIARASADADNLRAAVDFLAARQPAMALQVVTDLSALWWEGGLVSEGIHRIRLALDAAPPDAAARPMALAMLAWMLNAAGLEAPADGLSVEHLAQSAVQLAIQRRDRSTEAFALQTLGEVLRRPRPDDAVVMLERAIEVAVSSEHEPVRYAQAATAAVAGGSAAALAALWLHRDLAAAQRWEEEAVRWGERIGYSANLALGWQMLGTIALDRGEHADAERLLTAAENALRIQDLPIYRVWPLLGLARLAYTRFELADAGERFRDLTALGRDLGHREIEVRARLGLVDTMVAAGALGEAAEALDVLDSQVLNHPGRQAAVLIRRARLARLAGADVEGQVLLATHPPWERARERARDPCRRRRTQRRCLDGVPRRGR